MQSSELQSLRVSGLRHGQAMILAVLALGGAILGATTIAGLLMTYQIRQSGDFTSSAQAIFAADAGVECGLYNATDMGPTGHAATPCPDPAAPLSPYPSVPTVSYVLTIDPVGQTIYSQGIAGTARRAFLVLLDSATTTVP